MTRNIRVVLPIFCILVDFPTQINTIRDGLQGAKGRYFKYLCTSVSFIKQYMPDGMARFATFHLGIHCLQKYHFRGFQNTMGPLHSDLVTSLT